MAESKWEAALIHLHEVGWDMDDIDSACESLLEACSDGIFEGTEPRELDAEQLAQLLGDDISAADADAVVRLAELKAREDPEAEALREALWDMEDLADRG